MLGVPQVWSDNTLLSEDGLRSYPQVVQLVRLLLIIAGSIIDRSEAGARDPTTTHEIDQLLQCASACMRPRWWLVPDVSEKSVDVMAWTQRITLQLTHYFLVTQLHLPYIMSFSDIPAVRNSKMTAISASREVLHRFLPYRNDTTSSYYCHGVDSIAFFASVALSLAPINNNCTQQTPFENGNGSTNFSYLIHQRSADRGLVEKTLECMQETARIDGRPSISGLVDLLQSLLSMESASRTGATITVDLNSAGHFDDRGYSGLVSDGGNAVQISIPHCGKVQVVRVRDQINLLPTLDSQFDLDLDWLDPRWVSEATGPALECAGAQTPECSEQDLSEHNLSESERIETSEEIYLHNLDQSCNLKGSVTKNNHLVRVYRLRLKRLRAP